MGLPIAQIMQATGLTHEQINKLKTKPCHDFDGKNIFRVSYYSLVAEQVLETCPPSYILLTDGKNTLIRNSINATPKQRQDFVLSRYGIHWPEIDEDLSFEGLFADAGFCSQATAENAVYYQA